MKILNAHFVGKTLVLDDTVPDDLPAGAKVRVVVDTEIASPGPCKAFAAIAKMAVDAPEIPVDYSENHDKYLRRKGVE